MGRQLVVAAVVALFVAHLVVQVERRSLRRPAGPSPPAPGPPLFLRWSAIVAWLALMVTVSTEARTMWGSVYAPIVIRWIGVALALPLVAQMAVALRRRAFLGLPARYLVAPFLMAGLVVVAVFRDLAIARTSTVVRAVEAVVLVLAAVALRLAAQQEPRTTAWVLRLPALVVTVWGGLSIILGLHLAPGGRFTLVGLVPNSTAVLGALAALAVAAELLRREGSRWGRVVMKAVVGLVVAMVLLTATRLVILALLAGFVMLGRRHEGSRVQRLLRTRSLLITGGLVIGLLLIGITLTTKHAGLWDLMTLNGRFVIWQSALSQPIAVAGDSLASPAWRDALPTWAGGDAHASWLQGMLSFGPGWTGALLGWTFVLWRASRTVGWLHGQLAVLAVAVAFTSELGRAQSPTLVVLVGFLAVCVVDDALPSSGGPDDSGRRDSEIERGRVEAAPASSQPIEV